MPQDPGESILSEIKKLLCELTGEGAGGGGGMISEAQPRWLLLVCSLPWGPSCSVAACFLGYLCVLIVPCFIHFLVCFSFSSACMFKTHHLGWGDDPVVGSLPLVHKIRVWLPAPILDDSPLPETLNPENYDLL